MANFAISFALLIDEEGGYVNNPVDAGGETYAGISRHFNSNWPGWPMVDHYKVIHPNLKDLNAALASDTQVQLALSQFYKFKYWNFDSVPSQLVANKMLEMEVNFGSGSAVKILQQGLVRLGYRVSLDGSLGPATILAMGNAKEPDLLHALRTYSVLYRVHRILAQPDQIQFLEGWVWRDCS